MMIQTNTTDRKALVKAIAEELHTEYRYLRTPTYAYEVGDPEQTFCFTVDRDGNIIGEDLAPLHDFLLRNGYIAEDADTATGVSDVDANAETAADAAEIADTDAEATDANEETADANDETVDANEEIDDATVETAGAKPETDVIEDPEAPAEVQQKTTDTKTELEAHNDSEAAQPVATETNIDTQTITIPAPGITVEQLRNLTFTLYSRQYILNLMIGGGFAPCGDTIQIPDALVESLKNTLPDTPEHFSGFLEIYKGFGLKGFDFKDGQFTLTFPFYENEPTKWTAFAGLQGRILQAAMAAKRVFPEILKPEEEAEKYTAHMWLQRLGYKGSEMKEQRSILLRHLHGYCAFSNGAKMQSHKEKYSAIRRERREAERTTEADAIVETIVPIATADNISVMEDAKEVASDE